MSADPSPGASYRINVDYRGEHVLADGTKITLRLIRPEDGEPLRQGFSRLSPTSRYRRFLTGMSELSDDMVRYLTEVDGVDHVAVVATTDSLDLKTEIGLGVARVIRLHDEPTVAEAAVTVSDDAQRKGIGRLLVHTVAEAALERGVQTIRAEVLATNAPMRRLLDDVGAVVRSDDGTTLVFDIPLEWHRKALNEGAPSDDDHPLWRLFRAVAQSLAQITGP
ncbi:MAG: GNAT family N-acetyltransferase [Byssovorax sp.]